MSKSKNLKLVYKEEPELKEVKKAVTLSDYLQSIRVENLKNKK